MGHFRIKKLIIFAAIALFYLHRIQGMENIQDIGKIEDEKDVKTKELLKVLEVLEDWIRMLNATKKIIDATIDKINAMTEYNFNDDEYGWLSEDLSESITLQEDLLGVKKQHEFNINEKFDNLKAINPNFANAVLKKYPELTELFLTPPKLTIPRILEELQHLWNEEIRVQLLRKSSHDENIEGEKESDNLKKRKRKEKEEPKTDENNLSNVNDENYHEFFFKEHNLMNPK